MFSVINVAPAKPKVGAGRACDQCKRRKVRCDMDKPCGTCTAKGFDCTYNRARRKRGPPGKRIAAICRQQEKCTKGPQGMIPLGTTCERENHEPRPINEMQDAVAVSSTGNSIRPDGPSSNAGTSSQHESPCFGSNGAYDDELFPPTSSEISERSRNHDTSMARQIQSNPIFPSLPADSPCDTLDPFGGILQQDLPPLPETEDVWPQSINEATLLPWIDVYFKRLHPTIPILNRSSLYRDMLLRKHHTDRQYGAMLLGLCAFAMTQPVQIHELATAPSRSAQAQVILEKCVQLRVTADFGEDASIEMVLTSFFLFACLFGNDQHKAAWHRLREAVDLAYSLGLHLPQPYDALDAERKEQYLRTYLVLSVTERAYAIQQWHSIDFRGRPGLNARFMQAFDPTAATGHISRLIYQDQSDSIGMTSLLYLMETFDAIDESVIECWNGDCKYSDGACDSFDRRRALQMFRAQHGAREACLSGNISFAPSAAPLPLDQLVESQRADISVTQFWLLDRLWNLCLLHGLLRESSDHPELRYSFACQIAKTLLETCDRLSLSVMEVHGVGLAGKIYDIAMGVITAINVSARINVSTVLTSADDDVIPENNPLGAKISVRQLLEGLDSLIQRFRGGDHKYASQFDAALRMVPAYRGWSEQGTIDDAQLPSENVLY